MALEPCDRSQRSPTKAVAEDQNPDQEGGHDRDLDETESKAAPLTANVPAGLGLRRSFTDDYISQVSEIHFPQSQSKCLGLFVNKGVTWFLFSALLKVSLFMRH